MIYLFKLSKTKCIFIVIQAEKSIHDELRNRLKLDLAKDKNSCFCCRKSCLMLECFKHPFCNVDMCSKCSVSKQKKFVKIYLAKLYHLKIMINIFL